MTLAVQNMRQRWRSKPGAVAIALVFAVGALSGVVGARAAGTPAAPVYSLDNSAKTFSMKDIEKTAAGYQYWFFDKAFAEGRTVKLSMVGPHQRSHPPHQHEGHEFFFVLSGKAEFFLDGKTRVVGPQTALYCPPGVMHGIANVGDTELTYLVIKDYPWPSPPEATQPEVTQPAATQPAATQPAKP